MNDNTPNSDNVPGPEITAEFTHADPVTRADITVSELKAMVHQSVGHMVMGNETFSAWDVTRAVRIGNPTVEIDHALVKGLVHRQMEGMAGYTALYGRYIQYVPDSALDAVDDVTGDVFDDDELPEFNDEQTDVLDDEDAGGAGGADEPTSMDLASGGADMEALLAQTLVKVTRN